MHQESIIFYEKKALPLMEQLIKTSKIFKWLYKNGISDKEMLKTFNCGVGFCLIINPRKSNQIKRYFTNNFKPYVIGKITKNFKEK